MKRRILILFLFSVAILWAGLFGVMKWVQQGLNQSGPNVPVVQTVDAAGTLSVLWDAPAFSLTDQSGKNFSNHDLLGHPYVADFIYTQCTSACPVLTSKLLLVQKQVTSPDARFVSFSVDPAHDTPTALLAYEQLWHGDTARWNLLATTDQSLQTITQGFNVVAEKTDNASNPILHTSLFFLVDSAGKVRGLYDSGDETAVRKLVTDLNALTGNSPPVSTDGTGAALFTSMGCLACHSQSKIAPPLQSVYNGMVRLDNHKTVWADEAYLHESIVDPNTKVVAGYTRSMPSYRNFLTDAQVASLVEYIKTLSDNPPGGHGYVSGAVAGSQPVVELLRDPVCKMQVRAQAETPRVEYRGKVRYFCSQACLERFQKNPELYPLTDEAGR